MRGAALLALSGIRSGYGQIEVLRGIDLAIEEGEIVTLIGANGAGKSTLLMTICGVVRARAGRAVFAGEDITGLEAHEVVRRGIAHAPEGRRIFPRMTVIENLRMGAIVSDPARFEADLTRVFALFPVLAERVGQRGGTLSGGEQQMLAIARALLARPRLLMLDEPSLGLAPLITRQIFAAIRDVNRRDGTTVLLVEQNAHLALAIASRGYVFANGAIALAGSAADLRSNPMVQAAYLEGGAAKR